MPIRNLSESNQLPYDLVRTIINLNFDLNLAPSYTIVYNIEFIWITVQIV